MPNLNIVVWGTRKIISPAYYSSSFSFYFLSGNNDHLNNEHIFKARIINLYCSPVKAESQSGLGQSIPVFHGLEYKLRPFLFLSCECVCLIILRVTVFSWVHITNWQDFWFGFFFMVWFVLLGFCLVFFFICCCCWGFVWGFLVVVFVLIWFFGQKRIKGSDFLHLTYIFLFIPSGWQRYQVH